MPPPDDPSAGNCCGRMCVLPRNAVHVRFLFLALTPLLAGCPDTSLDGGSKTLTTPFGVFQKMTIFTGGSGAADFKQPAFLRFGPDGRLYVTTYTGTLFAFGIDAQHQVTSVDPHKPCGDRLLTGLAFAPSSTADKPVLYIASNATPIYGAPDFSGSISRVDDLETGQVTDVITGLPRSAENHMTFELEFGPDDRLYICSGGNTNNGAPSPGIFDDRPEAPLSAALLVADVMRPDFNGALDVEVYAPGLRNTYGICVHSNGLIYGIDQGANKGMGGAPTAGGGVVDIPDSLPDEINLLLPGHYYGHPNPARGQYAFDSDLLDGTPYAPALELFPLGTIVTGITEYQHPNQGALPQGTLLMTAFIGDQLWYATLSADGRSITQLGVLAEGFSNPLDITVAADGTIYVLEAGDTLSFDGQGPAKISILQPL